MLRWEALQLIRQMQISAGPPFCWVISNNLLNLNFVPSSANFQLKYYIQHAPSPFPYARTLYGPMLWTDRVQWKELFWTDKEAGATKNTGLVN